MPFPISDHCDGRRFFTPGARTDRSVWELLRWMLFEPKTPWPAAVPLPEVAAPPDGLAAEECALTFINHCTWLLQWRGLRVLTDPIFSERASPVTWAGPRRVMPPGLALDAVPPIDVVLVSHNHYDHMDEASLRAIIRRDRPHVLTPLGNAREIRRFGEAPVAELDWWQEWSAGPLTMRLVPAQHWSNRLGTPRNTALWGGFWITDGARHVYFAGDSGYGPHFAAIRARCGRPDVSLLPIGAYEPRWFMREQHMNPADAVQAHLDLESRLSLGTHFGTFRLTNEGHDAPVLALQQAVRARGVCPSVFRVLPQGASFVDSRTVR